MQNQKPIFDQISTSRNLPTLPHILLKLLAACNEQHNNESINNISRILNNDPSLCAKIMKMVNSAFSGLSRRVDDIRQAVMLIGIKGVKNIATCACVYEVFQNIKGNGIFDLKRFWWHSLKCAVLARIIAEKKDYDHPDEAFLAGLLHDIGKLVLWVNFRKPYEALLANSFYEPQLFLHGETQIGATHCEVAAWLLSRWNMPPSILDPILFHHEPKNRILNAFPLVQLVYVANMLCLESIQSGEEGALLAREILGIEYEEIDSILTMAEKESADIAKSLDIDIDDSKINEGHFSVKDLKKREDLLREVRYSSLILGTIQSFAWAKDQNDILEALFQGIHILFDLTQIIFFVFEHEKEAFFGKVRESDGSFSINYNLTVPTNLKDNILIKAIESGNMLDSFSLSSRSRPNDMDKKIIRSTGKEGILCIPFVAHREPAGILVIGLSRSDFAHISKQLNLMNMLANQASLAMHAEYLSRSRLQTIQAERSGASSAMAQRIIHEVNNPLGIIKNYLKILDLKFAAKQIAHDEIRIINEEIIRISDLLQKIAEFSTEKAGKIQPVDVNAVLKDIIRISKESLVKNLKVDVQVDLENPLPLIMADKNGLKQVFINIIKNATEAMHAGGNLRIQTRYLPSLNTQAENDGYVRIYFIDDGPGIPEHIKERLFEPFITTKNGNHSGIGLSVVQNIVKSLKGKIICESKENEGTVFKIEFPVLTHRKK